MIKKLVGYVIMVPFLLLVLASFGGLFYYATAPMLIFSGVALSIGAFAYGLKLSGLSK